MIALGILLGSFPEVMWLWCALFGSFGLALGRASVGCLFAVVLPQPPSRFHVYVFGIIVAGMLLLYDFFRHGSRQPGCELRVSVVESLKGSASWPALAI